MLTRSKPMRRSEFPSRSNSKPLHRTRRRRPSFESLETRDLLANDFGVTSGPWVSSEELARLPDVPSSLVHEYDPVTKQEWIRPGSLAPELATAETLAQAAGFKGVRDLVRGLEALDDDSDGTGGSQEVIFGDQDDRQRVGDTLQSPYLKIGRLWMRFGTSEASCSGVMVSPYHVLTAGHCVNGVRGGGWADQLVFSAAQDGTRLFDPVLNTNFRRSTFQFFGEANMTWMRSYVDWTQSDNWDWDLALVTLDRRIGDFTGTFGFGSNTDDDFYSDNTATTAGYPGDLTPNEFDMWRDDGNASNHSITNHQLRTTDIDTWGGQSGSPVWYGNQITHGIVSHHSYMDTNGNNQYDPGEPAYYNAFTRMTSFKHNNILTWTAEDDGIRPPTDRPDFVDYDQWFNTSDAGMSTSSISAGRGFTVTAYPRNNGTAAAGNHTVRFYASTDNAISSSDYLLGNVNLGGVGPFEWETATLSTLFPGTVPAGNYFVGWIIDSDGAVTEFDEGNNTGYVKSSLLTVTAATGLCDFNAASGVLGGIGDTTADIYVTEAFPGPFALSMYCNGNFVASTSQHTITYLAGGTHSSLVVHELGNIGVSRDYRFTELGLIRYGSPNTVIYYNNTRQVTLNAGSGVDHATISSNTQGLASLPAITINGGSGLDSVTFDDSGSGILGGKDFYVTEIGLAVPALGGDIAIYQNVESVTLKSGAGNDRCHVGSNGGTLDAVPIVTFLGGGGHDEMVFNDVNYAFDREYFLTELGLAVTGLGDAAYYQPDVEQVTVKAGVATNLVTVSSNFHSLAGLPAVTVVGGPGLDQINLDDSQSANPSQFTVVSQGVGSGAIAAPSIPFTNVFGAIEFINLVVDCASSINHSGWNPVHYALGTSCTGNPPNGDFNHDGIHNLDDIDALVAAIAGGNQDPNLDMNRDGLLNLADRDVWLIQAGNINLGPGRAYRLGDANLDSLVDGSDFGIWNANKFTPAAAWSRGDLNADGFVDGSDFGIWNSNKFTQADGVSRRGAIVRPAELGNAIRVAGSFPRTVGIPVKRRVREGALSVKTIDAAITNWDWSLPESTEGK